MKYKLVKYSDESILRNIDIYGIYHIYETQLSKMKDNKHLDLVNSNPVYKKIYNDNIVYFNKLLREKVRKTNNLQNEKSINIYDIKYNQVGGQPILYVPLAMLGVSGSIIIGSVIAYVIYRILTAPKCRDSYPLTKKKNVKYTDIINLLVPMIYVKRFVPDLNLSVIDETQIFESVYDFLNIFSIILEIIAPDSIIGQLVSGAVEFVAGVAVTAATALSAGAVTAINYALKAFNLFKDAISFLLKFVNAIIKLESIVTDQDTKRILYDLFSTDFNEGPFGVKCRVQYIINTYAKDKESFKELCNVFNKLLSSVYNKLISFISKSISFAVPEGGAGGALFSTFISLLKCRTFDFAIAKLEKAYEKMSFDNQMLFERPDSMKQTLDNAINNSKNIFDFINGVVLSKISDQSANLSSVFDFISTNTDFLAFIINKVFAIVFTILHVLSHCAKSGFCS